MRRAPPTHIFQWHRDIRAQGKNHNVSGRNTGILITSKQSVCVYCWLQITVCWTVFSTGECLCVCVCVLIVDCFLLNSHIYNMWLWGYAYMRTCMRTWVCTHYAVCVCFCDICLCVSVTCVCVCPCLCVPIPNLGVVVSDRQRPFVEEQNNSPDLVYIKESQPLVFPCRVTNPDATVSLVKVSSLHYFHY